ncbi:uncharacterized protein LOC114942193 isoform X1 [Nylanderia fulva]|uniref:uncharacterized protein LOC114942193 isoform X1 n=1 Tax=Nylanderia fulva TaxID=613905 RepID=UPI0010FB6FC5|nr:uncharacterized protein LOC114942193 isoform X1 [Nylanderia fulva]
MPKAKYLDEDRLPFFLDESEAKIVDLPYMYFEGPIQGAQYNSPMLKGVAHQLRRWPNDLFSSFIAACLIISGLVLFAFITAIFCTPVTSNDNYCEYNMLEDEHSFNVYFVKEAGQVWSRKEFCYIEAAAREQPDLNIHLINLMRTSDTLNIPEAHIKMALATQNTNIHIADLSIDEFFSKSNLSNIAKSLSNGLLLMAARAYLLWNSPGVAMHPSAYCNLSSINKFRWSKEEKRNYTPNKLFTIDPTIDLQATGIQCQAFLGFLLQEISKNATQIYNLKDVLHKFCPRIDKCPEVQILDLKSRCSVNVLDCPTVLPTRNF